MAGHGGLVGSALVRRLEKGGYTDLLLTDRQDLDLADGSAVRAWLGRHRPEVILLAAARVGGILANSRYPADFIAENLAIELNVIRMGHALGVRSLLFMGSSCVYPRLAPQPIKEEHLLTGSLEPTNEPYAIAKIAGIKLCQAFNRQHGTRYLSVMPTNLYGPGDDFDLETSHVVPALLRKFHEAKAEGRDEVVVWGSGRPRREFLHVDDLADACVVLMEADTVPWKIVNVGCGEEVTIAELAQLIGEVVGYKGRIVHDENFPEGTPQKLLDVTRMRQLGWQPRTSLRAGIEQTYRDYVLQRSPRSEQPAARC